MKRFIGGWFVALCLVFLSIPVNGANFDGSETLICAAVNIMECAPGAQCREVTPESINAPRFLNINFKEKRISATLEGKEGRVTRFEKIEHINGKLILQGAEKGQEGVREGGVAWSMAITEGSGKMTLTASGADVGFVAFGECMSLSK